MRRWLFLAVVLAAVAGLPVTSAFAHAEPAAVKPGDGAVLTERPTTYEITMTQEMARQAGRNDIVITDAAGTKVTTVSAVIDNANRKKLSVPLPSTLAPGKYTATWTTLSAEDGDEATGKLTFTYDPNGTASPGRENLKEDPAAPAEITPSGISGAQPISDGGGFSLSSPGATWITMVAVGAIMFALGSGVTYAFVNRKA